MSKASVRSTWASLPYPIRWVGVAAVGGTLVFAGLVLMVLPGPGIPLLILGLLVLATEFVWAQRTLHLVRRQSQSALSTVTKRFARKGSVS
jgi:L-cystine uptake protein TcyP (sodium:dicarboxylate symporter family)